MRDWRIWTGIFLGLALSGAILHTVRPSQVRETGPFIPDFGGSLQELAVQFTLAGAESLGPVYRQFLEQLPATVTVYAVCPDESAFETFRKLTGTVPCRIEPVYTRHEMTCWARDRWVALDRPSPDAAVTLWMPRAENAAEDWPQRAGDQRIGEDLAHALPGHIRAWRSTLYFDGGDFVADERTVFVTPAVLSRNLQQTVQTQEELEQMLAAKFKKQVVLLHDAPEHHAGMYLMLAGHDTALVGDPALARAWFESHGGVPAPPLCPCGDDFSPATQTLFDNVARQCAACGYQVVRIPVVPGLDRRAYITFVNVILDRQAGRSVVYMPSYSIASGLTNAAERIWRDLGYEVRRVECAPVFGFGGTLRCLVSVLRRDDGLTR